MNAYATRDLGSIHRDTGGFLVQLPGKAGPLRVSASRPDLADALARGALAVPKPTRTSFTKADAAALGDALAVVLRERDSRLGVLETVAGSMQKHLHQVLAASTRAQVKTPEPLARAKRALARANEVLKAR
jgi:hypothetical protein